MCNNQPCQDLALFTVTCWTIVHSCVKTIIRIEHTVALTINKQRELVESVSSAWKPPEICPDDWECWPRVWQTVKFCSCAWRLSQTSAHHRAFYCATLLLPMGAPVNCWHGGVNRQNWRNHLKTLWNYVALKTICLSRMKYTVIPPKSEVCTAPKHHEQAQLVLSILPDHPQALPIFKNHWHPHSSVHLACWCRSHSPMPSMRDQIQLMWASALCGNVCQQHANGHGFLWDVLRCSLYQHHIKI